MTLIYKTDKSIVGKDKENIFLLTKFNPKNYYVLTVKPLTKGQKGFSIRLNVNELKKIAELIYLEAFTNEIFKENV